MRLWRDRETQKCKDYVMRVRRRNWCGFVLWGVTWLGAGESLFAGVNQWTSGGPAIGDVGQVATDPSMGSRVYAATLGGLFASTDSGAHWGANLLPGLFLTAVAVDPGGVV